LSEEDEAVPLPRNLLNIVDDNRGELSRADFIDLCVRTSLRQQGQAAAAPAAPAPVRSLEATPVPAPARPPDESDEGKGFTLAGDKFVKKPLFRGLWALAIVVFGVVDVLTTWYAFSVGLTELNPVAALFGNILGFAFFKAAITIIAFLVSYASFSDRTSAYGAPILIAAVGFLLMANNLVAIYGAVG